MTLYTTSQADVKVKALSRFPAQVTANTGLSVSVANATYTFGFDFTGLTQNTTLATPAEWWALVYNETTGLYERVRLDAVVDYTIDPRRGVGNTDATIASSDRYVELTAALTTPRTWALPAASSVTGGVHIVLQDAAGGVSSTNTLTIQPDGSDTINGAASLVFRTAYDGAIFYSDGISKWTFSRGVIGVSIASGKLLTVSNTLTLTGTDGSSVAFGTGGTVAYTGSKLSAFAATTSAELAGVISDETGTGALVFANSPALVTPTLGTPASGTLTNCTIPVGGVSGLGTGVATALAVNVGSAGAPVVNGGALGTPSGGTLTSCIGLPIATGVSGLGTGVATFLATPSSANLASALTDETGSGSAVFATQPTITGQTLAAGTVSVAPQTFTSGTNLTTPAAGAVEYDGTVFYKTPNANNRGVSPVEQFVILTSSNTLTNNTSAQPIFDGGGGPANGALSLPTGTYFFEMMLNISGLSGSSHELDLTFAGSATYGNFLARQMHYTPGGVSHSVKTTAAASSITVSATTSTETQYWGVGTFTITAGGTIIPQITQITNSAAGNVLIGSYFRCHSVGTATVAYVGNWS